MKNIRRNKVFSFDDVTRELNYIRDILEKLPEEIVMSNINTATGIAETFTDDITARVGGGQTLATVLTSNVNRITTCTNADDSVRLPSNFEVGYPITIINDGVARCALYPSLGHMINNLIADVPVQVLSGQRMELKTTSNYEWDII